MGHCVVKPQSKPAVGISLQDVEPGHPVRPQLALMVQNAEEAFHRMKGGEFAVETKFDGVTFGHTCQILWHLADQLPQSCRSIIYSARIQSTPLHVYLVTEASPLAEQPEVCT